jgi:DNA modification methylase
MSKMIAVDTIYNEDCLAGMKRIPDGTVDLVITDPPYDFKSTKGGGAFGSKSEDGSKGRAYHAELFPMSQGFTVDVLDEMFRLCKIPNMYIFCSKDQVPQLLDYATKRRLNFDILTWHKPNPVPTCSNKYLSDTEYIIFMRGKGARVYGTYETKRKYWVQQVNTADKKRYGHPTVKPLNIIRQLIVNSSQVGGVVLDPFIGSGTTAVAAILEGRHYLGFEIDKEYYDTAMRRICNALAFVY